MPERIFLHPVSTAARRPARRSTVIMRSLSTTILLALPFISHSHPLDAGYNLRPFELELNATRMYDLIGETRLPKQAEYPGLGAKAGIDLGVLKSLKDQWSTTFDWDAEQRALNKSVIVRTHRR